MSRSPEAYLHTPTAYQTDLSCEAHDAGTHATRCGVFFGGRGIFTRTEEVSESWELNIRAVREY